MPHTTTTNRANPADLAAATGVVAFFRGAARRAAERDTARPANLEADSQRAAFALNRKAEALAAAADTAWSILEDTDADSPEYPARLAAVREAEATFRSVAAAAADVLRP